MSFLSPEGLPQDAQGQDRDGQARLMTDADGVARLMTDQVNAPVVEAVPPSSQPSSSRLDTNGTPLRAMNLDSFASGAETASIFNQTASPFIESMLPISTQAFDQSSTMPSVARHGGEQVPVENGARDPAQIPQDPWQSSQPPPLDPRSGPYAASEHLSTQYLRTRSPSPSRNNHFLSNGNKGLSLALSPSIPSSSPSSSRSSSVGESSRLGEYRPQGRQGVKTGLVYSHLMMLHTVPGVTSSEEGGDFHPEQPDRISRIFDYIKDHGCVAHMKRIQIREVKREEILLVHDAGMWEGIEKTAFFTTETLALETETLERTASLYINEHSAKCARLSCGGVIEMCDAVASGRVLNGFALVRPPGHHAEPDRSMGFCLYNNVAVATRFLQQRYGDYEGRERVKKVLILDWDVHHGNGTQQAFWDDENVLYMSLHRYENGEFFPGGIGGADDQVGFGAGVGRNVNIPWPDSGMGDGDYLAAFQRVVMPIAHEFAPDFVIISAGFDAAEGDHLGQCRVTPNGYAQMTHELAALANGRLVVALEGGYNLDSIERSALSVTNVLLGEAPQPVREGTTCSVPAHQAIRQVELIQAKYWKSIQPTSDQDGFEFEQDGELPLVQLPELIKAHRLQAIARKYQLGTLPVLTYEGAGFFDGSVLTSMDLLDRDPAYSTIVLFAHDMGNLRAEIPLFEIYADRERAYMVDASSKVIDWALARGHAIIDVNVDAQLPTTIKPPILTGSARPRIGTLASDRAVSRRNQAREALLYVWDNFVEILQHATPPAAAAATAENGTEQPAAQRPPNVVLIGHGTACEAVLQLIEERHVEACVKAVVQIPAHSTIPAIAKGNPEKRKWYWNRSKVVLPFNHALYSFGEQERSGKRLGKTERSKEVRAVKVLLEEFEAISTFVDAQLKSTKKR